MKNCPWRQRLQSCCKLSPSSFWLFRGIADLQMDLIWAAFHHMGSTTPKTIVQHHTFGLSNLARFNGCSNLLINPFHMLKRSKIPRRPCFIVTMLQCYIVTMLQCYSNVTYMSRPPHPPPRHSQIPRHIDSIKDNYSDDYDYNNKNKNHRRNSRGMLRQKETKRRQTES